VREEALDPRTPVAVGDQVDLVRHDRPGPEGAPLEDGGEALVGRDDELGLLGADGVAVVAGADADPGVCALELLEDEAIAALLHDLAEDHGGRPMLDMIRQAFGDRVASIVEGCSDTLEEGKPDWRPRKERYIAHLREASAPVRRVAAADKVHNLASLLRDVRERGVEAFVRFETSTRHDQVWYFKACAKALRGPGATRLARRVAVLADRLERAVDRIDVELGYAGPLFDSGERDEAPPPEVQHVELPDLPDLHLHFTWALTREAEGREVYSLRLGNRILHQERAYWEDWERFVEVRDILKARYGDQFCALVPTWGAALNLGGDYLGAFGELEIPELEQVGLFPAVRMQEETGAPKVAAAGAQ